MKRKILSALLIFTVGFGLVLLTGCETKAQSGALVGGGVGALAGQAIGRDTTGTLIGAGVGTAAGYLLGNEQDKAQQRRDIQAAQYEYNTVTVWITNSNGSQIPVRLVREGPAYIGPRGERYPSMPTEAQLRQVYGF